MKGKIISQRECFDWLREHYPELYNKAEADRKWIWLAVNLKDDQYEPVRRALSEFGFRFAFKGHALPSGAIGTWSHHCEAPIPFKRGKWKGRGRRDGSADGGAGGESEAALLARIEATLMSV